MSQERGKLWKEGKERRPNFQPSRKRSTQEKRKKTRHRRDGRHHHVEEKKEFSGIRGGLQEGESLRREGGSSCLAGCMQLTGGEPRKEKRVLAHSSRGREEDDRDL